MSAARMPPIALEVSSILTARPSGVGVFGSSLISTLRQELGPDGLRLLARVSRYHLRRHGPAGDVAIEPYLTGALLERRFPLLHALDTRLPALYRGRLVATLFDVISALPISAELRLSPDRFRRRKCRQYTRIARRADAVITISEDTRTQFLQRYSPRGTVHVVPPGVDPIYRPGALDAERLASLGVEPGRYVLAVGELCTRKNLEGTVEAFREAASAAPGLRLVLVGRPSYGWEGSAARALVERSPREILTLGFVSRDELAALYAGASALLYLSHYEGFGLPVLEAMASGAPVVASDRGGIREAAGEAAVLVSPRRPGDAAAALRSVLLEPGVREKLGQAGRRRAREFSWARCCREVLEVYRQVLDRRVERPGRRRARGSGGSG